MKGGGGKEERYVRKGKARQQGLYTPKACLAAFYEPGNITNLFGLHKRLVMHPLVSWLPHRNCKIHAYGSPAKNPKDKYMSTAALFIHGTNECNVIQQSILLEYCIAQPLLSTETVYSISSNLMAHML